MLETCHCMLACMLTPLDLAFEDTCLGVIKRLQAYEEMNLLGAFNLS